MATTEELEKKIHIYDAMFARAQLFSRMGLQYTGNRDVYKALGYPLILRFEDYYGKYERHDIAKAVINRPIQATWRGDIQLVETNDQKETTFEKAWKDVWKRLSLKNKFVRLDKLASMGKYGILLLGLDDVKNTEGWRSPVSPGTRKLNFVKPLSEGSAKINSYDDVPSSVRFGLPLQYNISTNNPNGSSGQTIAVHYTRVIHVTGEQLESEVDGVPVLQAIYNRLMDLEKLIGASAEMFWRGARPGFQGKVDPDFTLTQEMKDDLRAQWDEYENDLRRILMNEGVEFEPFQMQVADPRYHVDVQIQMISAVTGIPKRILVGSERGELASTEDKSSWLELIQSRQKDYAEVQILRPFITKCQEHGILPSSEGYHFIWPDLFSPSEKERAAIGQTRAAALQSYMNNPAAEIVIPPEVFIEFMLGLDENQIEYVKTLIKSRPDMEKELSQLRAAMLARPGGQVRTGSPSRERAQGGAAPAPKPKPTVQEAEDADDAA